MIDLTPLEVRQKKGDFRSAFRGYDPELVNDFLDLVADRMEELVKRNMELGDRVEALDEELEIYRTKERALSDALMTAQKLREDARSHADKEGELMIREARLAAEAAHQEATRALAREEETLRQVRARRAQLVDSFRRMLERELNELTVIEDTLELEAEAKAPPQRAGGDTTQPPDLSWEADADADAEPSAAAPEPSGSEPKAEAESKELEEDEDPDMQEDWLKSLVEE